MASGMDTVFVTGATGFIGGRLVETLADRGDRVRALARRPRQESTPGLAARASDAPGRGLVEMVLGDVTDAGSVLRGMEGCTHVYHLAGYAKNWARDPEVYFQVNVQGMRNVFAAARRLGVERVVWTSTELTFGPTRPGEIGNEETPPACDRCFTEYQRTKTVAEQEAVALAAEGLPVVIVNPCRVYGPGRLTEGNSVSLLIDQYDRGLMPFLLNRGVNRGNWVLVDDVVEGHLLAMQKGRIGHRYLLGGEIASLKEFLNLVDQVSGKRHLRIPLFRLMPMVFAHLQKLRAEWFGVHPQITPGWVRVFSRDWARTSEKAERELGYRPTPLVEGLRITYQWLQRVRKEQA